jgi:hypothetical protein
MDHEIIDAQEQRALDFLSKRFTRFLQHHVIGSGKIDEVIAVNQHGRDLCLPASFAKQ